MMEYTIDEIMDMLDWNNPIEIQKKGIRSAENIYSINVFILPLDQKHNKNVWENCANILYKRSDEMLEPYLIRLLEWLEDLNWPGAMTILERLNQYNKISSLSFAVRMSVQKAFATNNQQWLDHLSELLLNENLKLSLPENIVIELEKRYNHPGEWEADE